MAHRISASRGRLLAFALSCLLVTPSGGAMAPPPSVQTAAPSPWDASIRRDDFGVPHIRGRTDADVAFGFAYASAEDDFATIQRSILTSRGLLAATIGEEGLTSDLLFHRLQIADKLAAGYERDLPIEVRIILDGYAAGVNLYAHEYPEAVQPLLGEVTGRDIAAIQLFRAPMFYGLNDVVEDILTGNLPPETGTGSNAVALAPRRSADGHTRLLFNAHQPFTGPFTFYEAVLQSDAGWHVAGGFFPGTPFLLGGHNAHLGWAATTNRPDLIDVYRLTVNPANEAEYRLDGVWVPFRERSVRIAVAQPDGEPTEVVRTIRWSEHGPVFDTEGGTFAMRYPEFGGVKQLLQYYRMNKSRSLEEWRSAMRIRGLSNINYIYADEAGNIGFLSNGLYPERRDGIDWKGVVPGDRSELIWTDLRPFEQIPQIWNPRSGWLYNANNTPFSATDPEFDLDPDQFRSSMGLQTSMTNRAFRALETYGMDRSITAAEFDRYKYDLQYSRKSEFTDIVDAIRSLPKSGNPLYARAGEIAADWDWTARTDSRSMALIALSWLNMRRYHITAEEAAPRAIAFLQENYGRLDPEWGTVNRLRRGLIDIPLSGGPEALRAIYGRPDEDGRLRAFNGDGYVMFVEWDENGAVSSRSVHQFGAATTDAKSPHFSDQAPIFAGMETKPVYFTEEQLKEHIERSYRPGDR